MIRRAVRFVDQRSGTAPLIRKSLRYVFPDHWSFLLGEVALYSFVVLVLTFLSPGLRFFHQGQFLGRKKRISPHLCRAPIEPTDPTLETFYGRLLTVLRQPVVR